MKIKVKIPPRNVYQEIEIAIGTTVSELLQKLQLQPGPFVVLKDNVHISNTYVLNDNDEISILQVIFGG